VDVKRKQCFHLWVHKLQIFCYLSLLFSEFFFTYSFMCAVLIQSKLKSLTYYTWQPGGVRFSKDNTKHSNRGLKFLD